MKRLFAFAALVAIFGGRLFGAESIVFTPGDTASVNIPNSAPFNPVSDLRVELRIHDYTQVAVSNAFVFDLNTFTAPFVSGQDKIYFNNWVDTLSGGGIAMTLDLTKFNGDIVVRFQRRVSDSIETLEAWNADGSFYELQTRTITAFGTGRIDGTREIGRQADTSLAYLRVYSTLVDLGTAPSSSVGDLANWELEGTGADTSGRSHPIAVSCCSFATTPALDPVADAGALGRTVKTGATVALDASNSWSSGAAITDYLWEIIDGPEGSSIDDATSITTTLLDPAEGEYTVRLTVTNAAAGEDSQEIRIGVVAADENNVVTPSDPNVTFLFGPMLLHGTSPWPHLDDRQKFMADLFGALQDTDPTYADTWSTAASGTISVTNGSTAVTGTGTSFQAYFCGGGSSPVPSDQSLVVWFADGSGGFAKRDYPIASCSSATAITLSLAYAATSGTTGSLNYSKQAYIGNWAGGSDNNNYYDVVMALYSMYYRSGLTKYRDYARTLAQRWWTNPRIDKMNVCTVGLDKGSRCTPSRIRALTGVAWWLYEAGDPLGDGWDRLYAFHDTQIAGIVATSNIPDIRESAYDIAHMAVSAKLGPNSTKSATYAATLETAITNRWGPQQQANGEWTNLTYGCSSWNGSFGTITVTNGSTIVTGSGTSWTEGCSSGIDNLPFWAPNDTTAYVVESLDSTTQVTLTTPYAGTTRSGNGWQFYNLVGRGTQPFMMGVIGRAWNYVYQLTDNATARQFVIDAANWIATYGINAGGKTLYYARVFPNCEPDPDSSGFCVGTGRFLQAEVGAALAAGYAYDPSPELLLAGNQLVGAMLGELGGPETDGVSAGELATADLTTYKKAKNFGFPFGFGGTQAWGVGAATPLPSATIAGSVTITGAVSF